MRILSFKRNHDGTYALLRNGLLVFSIEAEKDSGTRHGYLNTYHVFEAIEKAGDIDVLVMSGWENSRTIPRWDAGYFGYDQDPIIGSATLLGKQIPTFSSSHERSHIVGGFAMSGLRPGTEFYALIWEGHIGSFYHVDPEFRITKLGTPMRCPGAKYEFLYHLMDPRQTRSDAGFNAGKLMALASFGNAEAVSSVTRRIVDTILAEASYEGALRKDDPRLVELHDTGFEAQAGRDAAALLSSSIYNAFEHFARKRLCRSLPLIITGGCGLNCNWNSLWVTSGLFQDVFVPPVCNDAGSAIGSAADAQLHFTGNAKIAWDVYSGEPFGLDDTWTRDFDRLDLDYTYAVEYLRSGRVLPWVQGRYEIGPRALGHRSLFGEPFSEATRDKLNELKRREAYRPIAPICLTADQDKHFETVADHRHMLFTVKVKNSMLKAVTHVDGTARLQSIGPGECSNTARLLETFGKATGVSVVCNTSLNFSGKGFINRMADLVRFANAHSIGAFVVDHCIYRRRP